MPSIEKSIYVNVPVDSAYALWTRFEDYPRFMDGVQEVRRLDDRALLLRHGGGAGDEEVVLTHHAPNEKLAWRSTSGPARTVSVAFAPTGAHSARLSMRLGYGSEDADVAPVLGRTAEATLKRFKELIEAEHRGGADRAAEQSAVTSAARHVDGH